MTDPGPIVPAPTPSGKWKQIWDIIVYDIGTIPAIFALIFSHWKTFLGVAIVAFILGAWFGIKVL